MTAAPVDVAFWTPQTGVAAVQVCRRRCTRGTLELTRDGGRTWRIMLRLPRPPTEVAVAGRYQAWATVGADVVHSRDGGRSWRRIARRNLSSVTFAGRRRGWAAGPPISPDDRRALVATRDGGRTWRQVRAPCRGETLAGVTFPTARRGWVVCVSQPGAGNQPKSVYATRDGGMSWHVVARASPFARSFGGIEVYGYPAGIAFAADGRGALWEGRGTLYLTADGGRHWSPRGEVARPEIDFGLSASFAGRSLFVLLQTGYDRRLLRSEDGPRFRLVRRWQM